MDVAFQVLDDWDDLYLTPEQKWGRVGTTGGGALLSGSIGLAANSFLVAAEVGTGPVPVSLISLGIGLGVDFLWGKYATPWIYEKRGYDPNRNLAPLQ